MESPKRSQRKSPQGRSRRRSQPQKGERPKIEVEAFGYFSADDTVDWTFDCPICWSRIYEYPFAIAQLRGSIHNTSWGYEGIHLVFRDWLDAHHSDVIHSDLRGPTVWDIRTPPPEEWLGRFDTLLSISTLEEVDADHPAIIRDHFLPQLRPGGRAVVTFDIGDFQVAATEKWLNRSIRMPERLLIPATSPRPDQMMGLPDDFRVGYLIMRKDCDEDECRFSMKLKCSSCKQLEVTDPAGS